MPHLGPEQPQQWAVFVSGVNSTLLPRSQALGILVKGCSICFGLRWPSALSALGSWVLVCLRALQGLAAWGLFEVGSWEGSTVLERSGPVLSWQGSAPSLGADSQLPGSPRRLAAASAGPDLQQSQSQRSLPQWGPFCTLLAGLGPPSCSPLTAEPCGASEEGGQ